MSRLSTDWHKIVFELENRTWPRRWRSLIGTSARTHAHAVFWAMLSTQGTAPMAPQPGSTGAHRRRERKRGNGTQRRVLQAQQRQRARRGSLIRWVCASLIDFGLGSMAVLLPRVQVTVTITLPLLPRVCWHVHGRKGAQGLARICFLSLVFADMMIFSKT